MIESITNPTPTQAAIAGAAILLGIARLHSSRRHWSPNLAWFWWPLRRYLWPLFDHALEKAPVPGSAKTTVDEDEAIVDEPLDVTLEELHGYLATAGYEAQPLASLARFDPSSDRSVAGELERSSLARYHDGRVGDWILPAQLLESLPAWLVSRRQTHVRAYGEDGAIVPAAHSEYNPWNPIYAIHHLLGARLDIEAGVEQARTDLGICDECAPVEDGPTQYPAMIPERSTGDEDLDEPYVDEVEAALEELRENLPTASKDDTASSQKASEDE